MKICVSLISLKLSGFFPFRCMHSEEISLCIYYRCWLNTQLSKIDFNEYFEKLSFIENIFSMICLVSITTKCKILYLLI